MTRLMNDEAIRLAWVANARPWAEAVRQRKIPSRERTSNAAIIEAIMALRPGTVIDLGCGEGWLARELAKRDITVLGVDAVPALVNEARLAGGGRFECVSYEEIIAGALPAKADLVVANFSLLGSQVVVDLFRALPDLINPGGHLVVQTLDPRGHEPYEDGWREGSWAGIPGAFADPAPWYFRTLQSWRTLFENNGMNITGESFHGEAEDGPTSVIFVATKTR